MARRCTRYGRGKGGRKVCRKYSGKGRRRKSYRGYGQALKVYSGFGALDIGMDAFLPPLVGSVPSQCRIPTNGREPSLRTCV